MTKGVLAFAATATLFLATPSFAQTVGSCERGGGGNQPPPVWILFELNSATVLPAERSKIADAAKTARDRQISSVCLVGHTDKLGDKAYNAKLARERSQAVATDLIRAGYPGTNIVIAVDPEAYGNMSLGSADASDKDRKVTILFSR